MNGALINLGDRAITAELTDQVITEASLNGAATAYRGGLAGMASVTLFARFVYGSGGTTCAAIVQTSLNGDDWIDIARFDFTTANAQKHATVGIFGNIAPAALAALGAEGKLDGILGDRLRVKVTSTGTYAGNTSLSIRGAVR